MNSTSATRAKGGQPPRYLRVFLLRISLDRSVDIQAALPSPHTMDTRPRPLSRRRVLVANKALLLLPPSSQGGGGPGGRVIHNQCQWPWLPPLPTRKLFKTQPQSSTAARWMSRMSLSACELASGKFRCGMSASVHGCVTILP